MAELWGSVRAAMTRALTSSPVTDLVELYPAQGGRYRVRGEFRRPYDGQLAGESNDALLNLPVEAPYGALLHGARVVFEEIDWTVVTVETDGEGWATLQLKRSAVSFQDG